MNLQDYREVAEIAVEYPIDMLEFNASCPHSDFVAVENHRKLLRAYNKGDTGHCTFKPNRRENRT